MKNGSKVDSVAVLKLSAWHLTKQVLRLIVKVVLTWRFGPAEPHRKMILC
jgi:hypothetical protein